MRRQLREACQPPDITRIVDGLSAEELRMAAIYLAGWAPTGFENYLLNRVQPSRKRRSAAVPDTELWLGSSL